MPEYIVLVDENDQVIGQAEKLKAHQDALLHRAFSVFVWRKNQQNEIEILLQHRQVGKYHSGGLWTNTCCSHPHPNETITDAGERRLFEESGLTLTLSELGKFYYKAPFENGLTEHEWDYVLGGQWQGERLTVNPIEAQAYVWQTAPEVQADLNTHPQKYTAWFAKALHVFITNLNK